MQDDGIAPPPGNAQRAVAALEQLLAIPATTMRATLTASASVLAQVLSVEKIDVWLPEPDGATLVSLGISDTPLGRLQHALGLDRLPLDGGGRIGAVFRAGTPFRTGHTEEDPEELEGVKRDLGIRSTLAVPMEIAGMGRGVLSATSTRTEAFGPEDAAFLAAAARWVAAIAQRAAIAEQAAAGGGDLEQDFQDPAARLGEQIALARAIAASVGEGIYAVDRNGRLTFLNPAAEGLLGWAEGELLGRDIRRTIRPQRLEGPLSGGAVHAGVAVLRRKDGSSLPVAYTAAPLQRGTAQLGTVVAFRDLESIQAHEREHEAFLAAAAHELLSPITAIRAGLGLLELGAGAALDTEERELLGAALRNVERLRLLVDDLLAGAAMQVPGWHPRQVPLDLRDPARAAAAVVAPLLQAKEQPLALDLPAALPVMGDPRLLEQLLVNLLANAQRHTPQGTPVALAGRAAGEEVRVEVRDAGPGIPADALESIFARFRRGDGGGTGLGLTIARDIALLHGGAAGGRERAGARGRLLPDPAARRSRRRLARRGGGRLSATDGPCRWSRSAAIASGALRV